MIIYLIFIIILLIITYICYLNNNSVNTINTKNDFLKDNILTIDIANLDQTRFNHIFDYCIKQEIPLKIKNGIKYFPKIKNKWNIDYIEKKFKNNNDIVLFQFSKGVDLNINNVTKCSQPYIKVYMKKYKSEKKIDKTTTIIDGITSIYLDSNYLKHTKHNPKTYLFRREKIESQSQNRIIDDVIPNIIFSKKDIRSYIIYNGPKNTGVLPHAHKHSLNILKTGKKKWIFCNNFNLKTSPNNIIKLHASNTNKPNKGINEIQDLKQDNIKWMDWYNTYKKYNENTEIECIQEAGDLIYVPNQLIPAVYNLENTCGLVIDLVYNDEYEDRYGLQLN